MDIQTRKIHFVQEFLRLKNEELISKFEKILYAERRNDYEKSLEPMSIDELNRIIDSAEDDSKNGRLTSGVNLKREIDSWT